VTADHTIDGFLGGRLRLRQPKTGYRAGVDPVLLAAAVPARAGQTVLELGCGGGTALLCLGARVAGLGLTGVELQPDYHALAVENAALNGMVADIRCADLRALPADLRQKRFDHVLMNPPYFDRTASTPATDDGRDIALGGGTSIDDWITAGAKRLAPKGMLTLVQRIERLPECLAAATARLGSVAVCAIAPRHGREPALFLIQARKGGRAAFRLLPPLVLHSGDRHGADGDDYTPEVSRVLRHAAALDVFSPKRPV